MLSIQERKEMREKLLEELYTSYFERGGAPISITREELRSDREKDLALKYLVEKGFILNTPMGNQSQITLTARGIDYIESK